MINKTHFQKALDQFDLLNSKDPNQDFFEGKSYPKELLYALRMSDCLNKFAPQASEALQLAARCQHICRWEISRSTFPIGRVGYHQWRTTLKKFHAEKAKSVLEKIGYGEELINRVQLLVQKKQLKKNPETQTLEDVICLVFLEHYFAQFAAKHPKEKVIDILQKTWRKMSVTGQQAALNLSLAPSSMQLIKEALD